MSSSDGKGDGRDMGEERGCDGEDNRREVGGAGGSEDRDDNVVRLPRDWLGPRDELVPFGPGADRNEGEQRPADSGGTPEDESKSRTAPGEEQSRPRLEEVGPAHADPVSPDDFWGERSAALQGTLDESERTPAESANSARLRKRLQAPAIAAAAAAAIALVVLACLSLFGQSPSRGRSNVRADVGTGLRREGVGQWPMRTPTVHWSRPATRSNHTGRGSSRQQGASPSAVPVSYSPQRASQSGSSSAGASGGAANTGASESTSPATTSSPSTPAPGPSTNSSTTPSSPPRSSPNGSHHQAAQTKKPPAFGSNGVLGPGHSPDG